MAEPFRHIHRVSYAECTVGDHIYHSRYLDLLEAARGEFMRALGRPVLALQDADYIFPVIEARLCYKFPARYDDLLTIEVWPTLVEKVRVNFGHRVLNQNGKLILDAKTFHCCTGLDEKPKRVPRTKAESKVPVAPRAKAEPKAPAAPRTERPEPSSRPVARMVHDEEPDDGWNGPLPGFLSVKLGS